MLVACNFTPVIRWNLRLGVPHGGYWGEILNSDATIYGGSGQGNLGGIEAAPVPAHGHYHSLVMDLPPLAVIMLKPGGGVETLRAVPPRGTKIRATRENQMSFLTGSETLIADGRKRVVIESVEPAVDCERSLPDQAGNGRDGGGARRRIYRWP